MATSLLLRARMKHYVAAYPRLDVIDLILSGYVGFEYPEVGLRLN
jgi:hypothetical protein